MPPTSIRRRCARPRPALYPMERVPAYHAQLSAGQRRAAAADYYTAAYGRIVFDRRLRARMTFADHCLATDEVFAEVHLVSCRNVLIYFDEPLQERAIDLFYQSLAPRGFLGLGSHERLDMTRYADGSRPWAVFEACRPVQQTGSSRRRCMTDGCTPRRRACGSASSARCIAIGGSAGAIEALVDLLPCAAGERFRRRSSVVVHLPPQTPMALRRSAGARSVRWPSRKRRTRCVPAGVALCGAAGLPPAGRAGTGAGAVCRSAGALLAAIDRRAVRVGGVWRSAPRVARRFCCPARMRTAPRGWPPSGIAGGLTWVQSPDSARVPLMPRRGAGADASLDADGSRRWAARSSNGDTLVPDCT